VYPTLRDVVALGGTSAAGWRTRTKHQQDGVASADLYTVKPPKSGHQRDRIKVSPFQRCPDLRSFVFLAVKYLCCVMECTVFSKV